MLELLECSGKRRYNDHLRVSIKVVQVRGAIRERAVIRSAMFS